MGSYEVETGEDAREVEASSPDAAVKIGLQKMIDDGVKRFGVITKISKVPVVDEDHDVFYASTEAILEKMGVKQVA